MFKIFDYIFYRVTKAYFKIDGRTGATGVAAVSLMQILILLNLFFFVLKFKFGSTFISIEYRRLISMIMGLVFTSIFIFNGIKYHKKFSTLKSRWGNENAFRQNFRSLLIIISFLILISLIVYIVNVMQI